MAALAAPAQDDVFRKCRPLCRCLDHPMHLRGVQAATLATAEYGILIACVAPCREYRTLATRAGGITPLVFPPLPTTVPWYRPSSRGRTRRHSSPQTSLIPTISMAWSRWRELHSLSRKEIAQAFPL